MIIHSAYSNYPGAVEQAKEWGSGREGRGAT